LSAPEQEEAGALAAEPARLGDGAVELELLAVHRLLEAAGLLAGRRVGDAAVERGELALEPDAGLASSRVHGAGRGGRVALRMGGGGDNDGRENRSDRFS